MFFDSDRRRAVAPREIRHVERLPQEADYMTDADVIASTGDRFYFDIEVYPNYFLIAFLSERTGKYLAFEQSPDSSIDIVKLGFVMWAVELVSFNGIKFDMQLLALAAIGGVTNEGFKRASDDMILREATPRDIARDWRIQIPELNHVDLIEVAPLRASLKAYAGRMHAKRLQELPYDPHQPLTQQQAFYIKDYCFTDLQNTKLLADELAEQIKLRVSLSKQYGQDLRSKSDAQIAEAVIVSEVKKLTGKWPKPAKFEVGDAFSYDPPDYLRFQTDDFKAALKVVSNAVFVLDENGSPRCPQLQEIELRLGDSVYGMGLGGLHSREKSRAVVANESHGVVDIDVASYYPSLILALGIRPEGMGDAFAVVYKTVVDRRLTAKAEGNKVEADSLKITANGTFGKLGSSHSAMYAPKGMIQITLTGQLAILMLIENVYLAGFEVASGNTDGVIVRYERSRKAELDLLVKEWEFETRLTTEETFYKAVYNRDVNNYIVIKDDNKVKLKGVYAEVGSTGNTRLSKNPEALILSDAVVAYLTKGVPLETTIRECKDIRRFVTIRVVKGGGELGGLYLGKLVRYYYGKGSRDTINYIGTGNKVPDSDGAYPCMDLPDSFPDNVDLDRYISEAYKTLIEIGHTKKPGQLF